jgi:hypothetical protein
MDSDSKLLTEQYTKVTESITGYRNVRLSDHDVELIWTLIHKAMRRGELNHVAADQLLNTLYNA